MSTELVSLHTHEILATEAGRPPTLFIKEATAAERFWEHGAADSLRCAG
jgi:hypothetical protein